MCGIAGIMNWNRQAAQEAVVMRMVDAISHRGPDGFGVHCHENVGIGHRRLSIIDLEGGKQPLSNEDDTIWITFNGEIYNYVSIRDQLIADGHRLKTASDTEVIVHAYEKWGDDCVSHLRGMFSFAIFDTRKKRMLLAIDPLGIKPLYYYDDGKMFAFSSELSGICAIPDIDLRINLEGIDKYVLLNYIPAPLTAFQKVWKLPAATYMSIDLTTGAKKMQTYWELHFKPNYSRKPQEWVEIMDAALRDSVKAHLVADVPFGVFLSGGLDSSAVLAYMSQVLNTPVKTFSIGFAEAEYNELSYADFAANRFQTQHHKKVVKADAMKILPDLVKHYGEPFGDNSAIPTYYVCQMAREHVPMVLSGDGGDESFIGYDAYFTWKRWLMQEDMSALKKAMYPIASKLKPDRYLRDRSLDSWLKYINPMNLAIRRKLWKKEYLPYVNNQVDAFASAYAHSFEYDLSNQAQYLDIKTYLPYDICKKVDIASMIHSLEVRTPIVDKEIMELAATIPEGLNIFKNQETGQYEGKGILKAVMKKYYPDDFVNRKKMGFTAPVKEWLSFGGKNSPEVFERLLGNNSRLYTYFEKETLQSILTHGSTNLVWSFLVLDEWLAGGWKSRTTV